MLHEANRILLLSSSNTHGTGYLDHAESEIRNLFGDIRDVLFVPYALHDLDTYAAKAADRFRLMGVHLKSIHQAAQPRLAVEQAQAIFIGGGNTFRLLNFLYRFNLLEPIRRKVASGMPYIGSSAGSNVAGPTIKTTKDMPIIQPPSFDALCIVPFQISPHYQDPDPTSKHMGETQEERILQFLEDNDTPVAGLRESTMVRIEGRSAILKGPLSARLFRKGVEPREAPAGSDIIPILFE